jgi:predicted DNA binding CopG/RHH family protein
MTRVTKKDIVELLKDIAFNTEPLDNEEKKDLNAIKNINENNIKFDNKALSEFKQAQNEFKQKYKREIKKDKLISIRLNSGVLNEVKNIADDLGLNYQSYISLLINYAVKGDIKLMVEQKNNGITT